MTRRCLWLALPALAVAGFGCGNPTAPPTTAATADPNALPTVVITTAPAEARAVRRDVAVVGTLGGFDEVTLAPKADGRVIAVHADVGDPAIPGMVLLELDPTDYLLTVEEAERALDAELARVGLTELPPGSFDVEQVPSVRKATVALENARVRAVRVRDLFDRKAAAKDEYDVAYTDFKLAEATKQDVVTQAQATLASARLRQATLETARQKLDDCKLRVPVPAVWPAWAAVLSPGFTPAQYQVAQRLISEGVMVRSMPVTDAFKLVIDSALKFRAAVPERYSSDVDVGQPVDVKVDAYPNVVFPGRVTRVSPTVDPQNRTFQTEIAVPNLDGRLKAGGFARAAIRVRVDNGVVTVPPSAVHTFAGVTKVFVIEGGTARAVPVDVGVRDKAWVEVIGAVPPDATVATSGLSQLVDGSPIKIRGTDGK